MINSLELPIAVQLWSVREDCNADFAGALAKIAEMGYDGVETAGLCGLSAADAARAIADAGLRVEGAHTGIDSLLPANRRKTMDDYAAIGCRRLIVPWIGGDWTASSDGWKRFFATMNLAAEDLAAEGFELGYHNHDFEFRYVPGLDLLPMQEMFRGFSSRVRFQFDMGWVYAAGVDGVDLACANRGRVCSIHAKAFKKGDAKAYVGEDDVPWEKVIVASAAAGADWIVVEHENYADTPMNCIRRDLDNLRR